MSVTSGIALMAAGVVGAGLGCELPRALLGAVGSSSPCLVGVLVWFGFL